MTNETRDEILDTIEVCEIYLADAAKHEGGPLGHIFTPDAKAQIAFERAKLGAI